MLTDKQRGSAGWLRRLSPLALAAMALAGCGTQPIEPSERHITVASEPPSTSSIPPLVAQPVLPPPPKPAKQDETFSVVVSNVPVKELLFALARDAKLNVDVYPGIEGEVTLNAIDQTLPQLLERIAKQVDLRYELDGPNLSVLPDTPFLRDYQIDYVNLARDTESEISVATQVASTGGGADGGSSEAGNNSLTKLNSKMANHFWETLVQNLKELLQETDKVFYGPDGQALTEGAGVRPRQTTDSNAPAVTPVPVAARGTQAVQAAAGGAAQAAVAQAAPAVAQVNQPSSFSFREKASVIAHPETGVIAIRATARQHEKIQEFLDRVLSSARRQVMVEATVVEVNLSDQYQAGIDWQRLAMGAGFSFRSALGDTTLSAANMGVAANPAQVAGFQDLINTIVSSDMSAVQKSNLINALSPGMGTLYSNTLASQLPGAPGVVDPANASVLGTPGAALPITGSELGSSGDGFTIGYSNATASLAAALKLLDTFGTSKVLSSPKLSVINNQTATLKVVSNLVYFDVSANVQQNQTNSTTSYTSTMRTVPVGFLMTVTPQIDGVGNITINVRPTISRLIGYAYNPNPSLQLAGVPREDRRVPITQVREMESVLRLQDRQIAVLGGLMLDEVTKNTSGLPGLSSMPLVGDLVSRRNDQSAKTELVIFLRPTIINSPDDYKPYRVLLPNKDFLKSDKDAHSPYQILSGAGEQGKGVAQP